MAKDIDSEHNQSDHPDNKTLDERRRVVRNLLVGGGAVAGSSALPDNWSKPLVQSVLLPAHAQTSPSDRRIELGGDFSLSSNAAPAGGSILDVFIGTAHALDLSDGCISILVEITNARITRIQVLLSEGDGDTAGYKDADFDLNADGSANFSVSLDGHSVSGTVDKNVTVANGNVDGASFSATRDGGNNCPKSGGTTTTTTTACPPGFVLRDTLRGTQCYSTTMGTTTPNCAYGTARGTSCYTTTVPDGP